MPDALILTYIACFFAVFALTLAWTAWRTQRP
jgi:multisubunit Na+/H+ antiporter MnhC subunit